MQVLEKNKFKYITLSPYIRHVGQNFEDSCYMHRCNIFDRKILCGIQPLQHKPLQFVQRNISIRKKMSSIKFSYDIEVACVCDFISQILNYKCIYKFGQLVLKEFWKYISWEMRSWLKTCPSPAHQFSRFVYSTCRPLKSLVTELVSVFKKLLRRSFIGLT